LRGRTGIIVSLNLYFFGVIAFLVFKVVIEDNSDAFRGRDDCDDDHTAAVSTATKPTGRQRVTFSASDDEDDIVSDFSAVNEEWTKDTGDTFTNIDAPSDEERFQQPTLRITRMKKETWGPEEINALAVI
jgi:hypothetical protein